MALGLGIVEQLSPTVSPDNFAMRGTIEDNCSTNQVPLGSRQRLAGCARPTDGSGPQILAQTGSHSLFYGRNAQL